MHSRFSIARRLLITLYISTGIAALYGAAMMFASPDGALLHMEGILPCFKVLPFSDYLYNDYIFPGIALLSIIGIPHLYTGIYLIRSNKKCRLSVILPGIILSLWIILQFIILPLNAPSLITFIISLAEIASSYACFVFSRQENMSFSHADYRNIGKDKTRAVVYFSRLGYVRKLAYEEADRTGALIIEVKAKERTEGTLGFWWCGRYGMHRWPMPIEHIDLSSYDSVTICTPIWVFGVAAPIRTLLIENRGNVREAKFIISHFQPVSYKSAAIEMCNILNAYNTEVISVETRIGKRRRTSSFKL